MTFIRSQVNKFINKYSAICVCLFLTITTLAVYVQIRHYDFVDIDDSIYVYNNRYIQKGLTLENIIWALTTNHAGNWHPLTWMSHMLDCQLFGMKPGWHHLSNLVFHIVNTLLLFLIFNKMTGCLWQSFFIAALFSLHPLHVESVAWVAERKDVLSTFFWMLTMWSYNRYVELPSLNRYFLIIFLFTLGLMNKPMLVTLPFVLLLLDFWPLDRFMLRHSKSDSSSHQKLSALYVVFEKVVLFILVALSSAVTIYAQKLGGAVTSLNIIPLKVRIFNALLSYVTYIEKTIFPNKLAVLYPYPTTILMWKVAAAFVLIVSISYFAIKSMKQRPYFFMGWLWYLGTLIPVIGLVQVGRQSFADRYTYVPLIGLFIIIAWGFSDFFERYRHKKIWASILTVILFFNLIPMTYKQIGYWKDYLTLCEHTLEVTSDNFIMHTYIGNILYSQGREEDAINHYLQALEIQPDFIDARINLGNALIDLGRTEEAINHYLQVLKIKPDFAEIHINLGNALEKLDRIQEATNHYLQAIKIYPNSAEAHFYLGVSLGKQGHLKNAINHLLKSLQIKPDSMEAHYNLGVAFLHQKNIERAINHFQKELQINPDFIPAKKNLSILMIQQQNQ
jgi:protein O-mannosyl-transferase